MVPHDSSMSVILSKQSAREVMSVALTLLSNKWLMARPERRKHAPKPYLLLRRP